MRKIIKILGVTFIILGVTSCKVTTYGGVGGRVASIPYSGGSSASWNWHPFEKRKIATLAKKELSFFKDKDFRINYMYCYYKATKSKENKEYLIVDECKEAYEMSKKMCFKEKNMQHCASVRNLSTEIYNDEKISTKAKYYLKYKNPDEIDFHLKFVGEQLKINYTYVMYSKD